MYIRSFLNTITAMLLFGITAPALAHFTINEGGVVSSFTSCSHAKFLANTAIQLAVTENKVTSRHVSKCEKDGDEYLVDWAVTGYSFIYHPADDHSSHSGRSSGDAYGTDSYGN